MRPATIFSRSTEAHNQDKVSMGTIAARDARSIVELAQNIAAIHLMACCQALELRGVEKAQPAHSGGVRSGARARCLPGRRSLPRRRHRHRRGADPVGGDVSIRRLGPAARPLVLSRASSEASPSVAPSPAVSAPAAVSTAATEISAAAEVAPAAATEISATAEVAATTAAA